MKSIYNLRLFAMMLIAFACKTGEKQYKEPGSNYTCNQVEAALETDVMDTEGDSADDPAVWIHPEEASKSLVITTNKKAGLVVYNLDGKEVQFIQSGRVNNVDVRYGFNLNGQEIDIVAASNRSFNSISIYRIEPDSGTLVDVAARTIRSTLDEVYGFCLYKSAISGKFYAFMNSKSGYMEQWELFATENNRIDGRLVRSFKVGEQTEGCVADDELGYLYVGEETYGIWKYLAEPDKGDDRKSVADTSKPYIVPDIEGLTIYYGAEGSGYLLASVQGDNAYAVFERGGKNNFLGCFRIVDSNNTDAVEETDGIDVINMAMNDRFPNGFFIAQDGFNKNNGQDTTQNFKMVPWENIANSFKPVLITDKSFDVRLMGSKE